MKAETGLAQDAV